MNPDKQRIAIAEACGWVEVSNLVPSPGVGMVPGPLTGVNLCGYRMGIPNYLHDLNAMHEAEKYAILMPNPYCMVFHTHLMEICNKTNRVLVHPDYTQYLDCVHATAAQRAEAFLRTIGKWEESE